MSIFGWGKQTDKNLKEVIVRNENLITQLRDDKIEAQIDISRAQSGFNAQQEVDRANHEIEIASHKRTIAGMKASFEGNLEAEKSRQTKAMKAELEADKANHRRELKAEFSKNFEEAKKEAKSAKEDSSKYQGLYNGALLVIKALEGQLKDANGLSSQLIKALPQVSAEITTPDNSVIVGSGNKS